MGKHGKQLKTTRYPTVVIEGHPLAQGDGRVRIHRAALYDQIGDGAHACHWCGKEVHWFSDPRIVVDHVNGDTWDNSETNLAPACNRCNCSRGRWTVDRCINGHEFTEANTYWRKTKNGKSRQCKACSRIRSRRYPSKYDPESYIPKRVGLEVSLRGATLADIREFVENHASLPGSMPIFISYKATEQS